MPRIRTIKPEFWKSETIAALPFRTRLTFVGLWTYVDDSGVGLDNFKLIAAELFGLEDDPSEARANVREDLARLHSAGRIIRYAVAGKHYLAIVNWDEHQRIDKPGKPRYPNPDHPDAVVLSRENDRETAGSNGNQPADSRQSRETFASVSRLEQGTGEQGNREQGTLLPPPPAAVRMAAPGADDDPDWCKFWDAYPLKVSKKDARTRYIAAVKKGAKPEDIIAGAEAYRDRVTREDVPRDKIKHPDGWLNGERWKDEAEIAALRLAGRNDQGRAGTDLSRRPIPGQPYSAADQRVAHGAELYAKYAALDAAEAAAKRAKR